MRFKTCEERWGCVKTNTGCRDVIKSETGGSGVGCDVEQKNNLD
jgi:hypothetical protein